MTNKFVSGTYHAIIQVAELITDDGRRLLRAGGTLPWRINNCGDLSSPVTNGEPTPRFTKNFIGFARVPSKNTEDVYHFFIFPDYETGRLQLKASLKRKYGMSTIPEAINKYAPKGDNDPTAYADAVLRETGIARNTKICDLTDDQLDDVTKAIQSVEGYDNVQVPRREVWIPVSTIVATDGVRPLADEEIVLRVNGKDTVVKTNAVGQAPPIVHGKGPVEVLHRTPDGQLQKVGTVSGDKGGHYSFWKNFAIWAGYSAPDKAPETTKSRPRQLTYVVQPNDSLSKIAARFKTTVDKLKTDNQLKRETIHPGEQLAIFGAASASLSKKATPKKLPILATAAPAGSGAVLGPTSKTSAVKKPPASSSSARSARSAGGVGKPLAIVPPEQGLAPWMAYAISEAKRLKGEKEAAIMKGGTNYHTAIHDTVGTMVGSENAWCAAFVNWCLSQAGYPIDHGIWAARAHGFISHDANFNPKVFARNPLFVKIDEPIYGAIAVVVTKSGGHGHHAGFVYAKESKTSLAILGGNQSDEIKFASYTLSGSSNVLWFYVPSAYTDFAKLDLAKAVPTVTAAQLNKDFGINVKNAQDGEDR